MDAQMLYLHAISPVHTGTGQAVDVIDLPVAREKTTNWPYLPGSSIKGILRTRCTPANGSQDPVVRDAFGPPTTEASEGAGMLLFGDARLLCLPVRSLYGVFAWVTCPLALSRFQRDHTAAGLTTAFGADPLNPKDDQVAVTTTSTVLSGGTAYLEDLDLRRMEGSPDQIADFIARQVFGDEGEWQARFKERFIVASDTTFSFLAETGTEVIARIKLNEGSKTAQGGALWYEEAIPAESIFSAPLLAEPRGKRQARELYELIASGINGLVQVGGHATVGRGLMRLTLGEERA